MKYWIILITICQVYLSACTSKNPTAETDKETSKKGYLTEAPVIAGQTVTVITFLGPECPLSENYTKTINDLQAQFAPQHIRFIDVFPGTFYSEHAIDSFITRYALKQEIYLDKQQDFVKRLQATITPETFIFDKNGKLVYSGAIDNWAVDLGVKRQVITEFYVRDVIQSLIDDMPAPYTKTQAVGCFIEHEAHHE